MAIVLETDVMLLTEKYLFCSLIIREYCDESDLHLHRVFLLAPIEKYTTT